MSSSPIANLPAEVAGKKTFGVQWSGFLTPTESGDFLIGIRCEGFGRLAVDDKQVAMAFGGGTRGLSSSVGRVHLEKGRKVALEISYGTRNSKPHAELIWAKVQQRSFAGSHYRREECRCRDCGRGNHEPA